MLSRHRRLLAGAALAALSAAIGWPALVTAQSGTRALTVYNIHTKETVTAVFKRGNAYDEAECAKLDRVMRDYRRNEATHMDRALFDLLWQVHSELGSKEPIHLISGFRSKATNEMLRRSVGGQASESRHILGKAADVHFPDVPIKKLRYSALIQERGGVGYYPTSAIPFVHVDTDRVRSWPRLPRAELALLFPSGHSKHQPTEGGPITRQDVAIAQKSHHDLAVQVAAFLGERRGSPAVIAIADARQAAPSPRLIERPTEARAPGKVATITRAPGIFPSNADRLGIERLASDALASPSLASASPRLVQGPQLVVRRANRPQQPSIASGALPVPSAAIAPTAPRAEPERQIAAIEPVALPAGNLSDIGRFGWGAWVPAPAFDDEHPEELSYRPFPIAPFLTETAEQPLMNEIVGHDVARTVEMLDQPDTAPVLRFRPSTEVAGRMWTQEFTGPAVGIERLRAAQAELPAAPAFTGLANRRVKTSQR